MESTKNGTVNIFKVVGLGAQRLRADRGADGADRCGWRRMTSRQEEEIALRKPTSLTVWGDELARYISRLR